jgi:hypothetical protein
MHLLVRDDRPVVAASVQGDVDGIPKGPHYELLRGAIDGSRYDLSTAPMLRGYTFLVEAIGTASVSTTRLFIPVF